MLLRIASTTLFLATNMPSVCSFPKLFKCDKDEYLAQLDSFRNDVGGMDRSIVSIGVHELHDQHLVDDDSPTCVQKASQVMREFSEVVMKEDHPFVVATEKVLGKENAHCFQSGLLILDAVHTSSGEEVPLDTIVFPGADDEDEDGIKELCGGLRQRALVNWATFVPPKNLPSGYVLTYSAVVSVDGEDCCGDSHVPLPLLHAQFTVEMGRYKSDKAGKGNKGAKHTKASEKDPKASKKERALVERRLC